MIIKSHPYLTFINKICFLLLKSEAMTVKTILLLKNTVNILIFTERYENNAEFTEWYGNIWVGVAHPLQPTGKIHLYMIILNRKVLSL